MICAQTLNNLHLFVVISPSFKEKKVKLFVGMYTWPRVLTTLVETVTSFPTTRSLKTNNMYQNLTGLMIPKQNTDSSPFIRLDASHDSHFQNILRDGRISTEILELFFK